MQKSFAVLLTVGAFSIPCSAYSEEATATSPLQVNSSEYQYDKSFVSPNRTPLLDKKQSVNLKPALESSWQSKNEALQLFSPERKARSTSNAIANNDFWIYDSWATLSNDLDYDGYYSTLTVEFDADTVYNRAYVYAIVYLGVNEVFESIHVTSVFAIDSDSSNDSFIVESELISGFPSNDYEIMIELYDADTDEFVAFSDGLEDADLSIAPLESVNYETLPEPTVVIVEEHGGSFSIFGLLVIALAFVRRSLR